MTAKSHEMPPTACPNCGKQLNRAAVLDKDGSPPDVGDVSICMYCGAVNLFGPGGILVSKPLDEIMKNLSPEERDEVEIARNAVINRGFAA